MIYSHNKFCHDLAKIKYPQNLQARVGVLEGGVGVPNKASQGGSATGYNPLTFYKPFLAEKVPLLNSLLTNGTPFTV